MPGLSLTLVRGTSADFPLTVYTPPHAAVQSFDGTEPISATLWTGADETSVLSPAVAWGTPPAFTVGFQDADTVALAFGIYYLQAFATLAGTPDRTIALLEPGSTLEILSAPGAATRRPAYIAVADLRNVAPWIDDLQVPDSHTGFDEQLADARDWIDECILRNYRGGNVSLLGDHGMALDAWFTGGSRRTSLTNRWMKDNLAANKLLVTPRIKRICAYYALSLICETLIDKGGKYFSLAARFRYEAEALLSSTTAEIDLNNDGYGEVPINFSSTNTLWA